MAKEISLEELNNSVKTSTVKTEQKGEENLNITKKPEFGQTMSANEVSSHIREAKGIEDEPMQDAPLVENAFNDMYKTINDRKNFIENTMMPIVIENAKEMALEEQLGTDTSKVKLDEIKNEKKDDNIEKEITDEDISSMVRDNNDEYVEIENKYTEKTNNNINDKKEEIDEKDEDGDELESLIKEIDGDLNKNDSNDEDDESVEELRSRFKESLTSVKISRDPIDLSKFRIRNKSISSSALLSNIGNNVQKYKKADWVLYHTGRSMTFTECRGPELDTVRKTISNSNPINAVVESLKFVYNHVLDAAKPDFESWCKLIRTEDIESLYFGLYRACYADTNIVARVCSKKGCGKTSLIDTDINDMVKYKDDETKEKFKELFNKDTTTETDNFESELLQVSDDIVISFTKPTLYSTFLQYSSLKKEITDKYTDTLNTMAYIDGFYQIDREAGELIPIEIKEYPRNFNKTVLSKLDVYLRILKTLNSDQYNILTGKLNNIITTPAITYIYPKSICPECGSEIPEENIDSVMNLLFTRARLVQVKNL